MALRGIVTPITRNIGSENATKGIYDGFQKIKEITDKPLDIERVSKVIDTSLDPKIVRFHTIIGLILSARTNNVNTTKAITKLLSKGLTVEKIVETPAEEIANDIYGVSFHNNKAKYIKNAAKMILEKYDGDIPNDFKKVIALPGIGQKSANFFLQIRYGNINAMAIDAHGHRIANRLGWVKTKSVAETVKSLQEIFPKDKWDEVGYALVDFGMGICSSQKPKCEKCNLQSFCAFYKSNSKVN
ncbi:unnamed protein product [Blepharisma stoltei]|uniref:HhH-GPD domain-containing protein n=1 Tax=Blepharisma stoltei TaxID=1481888 RepID=A0AAU9ISS4_9CILI|nr:unnamed protein product [Blepharisma stoltei]